MWQILIITILIVYISSIQIQKGPIVRQEIYKNQDRTMLISNEALSALYIYATSYFIK